MSTESQEKQILKHLKLGRSVTPLDGFYRFDCQRMGARIFDLRAKGWQIKTTIVKSRNGKKHYAQYSLTSFKQK